MGFELRQFTTKSKFNKWFQKGEFRSYYRVRFGQLVIEWREIREDKPLNPNELSIIKAAHDIAKTPIVEFRKEDIEEVKS